MSNRNATANLLIAALDDETASAVIEASERVDLSVHYQLEAPKRPISHAYFPESGVVSIITHAPGHLESLARSLLYVAMANGAADERGFAAIRRMRRAEDGMPAMTLAEFKTLIRDQFLMLLIDEEAAVSATPRLLPAEESVRREALSSLREVLNARGALSGEAEQRWQRIVGLFGLSRESLPEPLSPPAKTTPVKAVRRAS